MADLYDYPGGPGSPEWKRWYLNYEPDAGYANWMASMGYGMGQGRASDPFRSFLMGLYNDYQNSYKGQAADNPNLEWTDYLRQQDPFKEWQAMSPEQRGERPGQYTPRLRWVL